MNFICIGLTLFLTFSMISCSEQRDVGPIQKFVSVDYFKKSHSVINLSSISEVRKISIDGTTNELGLKMCEYVFTSFNFSGLLKSELRQQIGCPRYRKSQDDARRQFKTEKNTEYYIFSDPATLSEVLVRFTFDAKNVVSSQEIYFIE